MDKNLLNSLISIQTELKAPKSQYNSFGKYNYRNCEDILEAVKPLLKKYGVSLMLSDKLNVIGERYYVEALATLYNENDSVSATASAREEETKKGMDGSQITGSASSYARKYALNGLFCIDDTKDSDYKPAENVKPADSHNFKAEADKLVEQYAQIANKSNDEIIQVTLQALKVNKSYADLTDAEYNKCVVKLAAWLKAKYNGK